MTLVPDQRIITEQFDHRDATVFCSSRRLYVGESLVDRDSL